MLYIGEKVASARRQVLGRAASVDIAVDPLEGTTSLARAPNAITVLAHPAMRPAARPDLSRRKCGRTQLQGSGSLGRHTAEKHAAIAKSLGRDVGISRGRVEAPAAQL